MDQLCVQSALELVVEFLELLPAADVGDNRARPANIDDDSGLRRGGDRAETPEGQSRDRPSLFNHVFTEISIIGLAGRMSARQGFGLM